MSNLIDNFKNEKVKNLTDSYTKALAVTNNNYNIEISNLNRLRINIRLKNAAIDNINKKYQQLYSLGFYNIFVYLGGMFEWLLLQDIYGDLKFGTTKKELNILKYRATKN